MPAFSQVEGWQLATELREHVHLLTIGEVTSTQDAAGLRRIMARAAEATGCIAVAEAAYAGVRGYWGGGQGEGAL